MPPRQLLGAFGGVLKKDSTSEAEAEETVRCAKTDEGIGPKSRALFLPFTCREEFREPPDAAYSRSSIFLQVLLFLLIVGSGTASIDAGLQS